MIMSALGFLSGYSLSKTLVVLAAGAVLLCLDLLSRATHRKTHYAFGVALGTVLSLGLMQIAGIMLDPEKNLSGHGLALGFLLLIVTWRMLFGPWDARTKATVLGTFLFWIVFHVLFGEDPTQRTAHLLAIVVALIPAVVWCALFLPYHRERVGTVLCMFFAGMLATAPILFYDALSRRGIDLQFFLFRLTPQSFSQSAQTFVLSEWPHLSMLQINIVSMLVSFLIVGVIEEGSKFWVLRSTGEQLVTSIDDVLQLAILVAIGFAFAENINSSGYFVTFVRDYLVSPDKADWLSFAGNVAGRSVLTSMVHIVSTGVCGYFFGLALFAGPYLQEGENGGRRNFLLDWAQRFFGVSRKTVFRRSMIAVGYTIAVVLHASSNFMVSLPDALPGNPRTVGDLVHSSPGSPLHYVALLLLPTLLYVVGGFVLLTSLFLRKENIKERGRLILADTFVTRETER